MTLHVGETGKTLRFASAYDMSSNTELTLTFDLPDGTTVTKTKSGGEVTLGTGDLTDPDIGALLANQYVEYVVEVGFLSLAGSWGVKLTYTDTVPAPDDVFISDCGSFTVSGPFDCSLSATEAKPFTFISRAANQQTFHASYTTTADADSGNGVLTATTTGGPTISGGNLILDNASVIKAVDYDAVLNADSPDDPNLGTIRLLLSPQYTGNAPTLQHFVGIADTASSAKNRITIRHNNLGFLIVEALDNTGLVHLITVGSQVAWAPVSGTEYEIELNFDFTSEGSITRIFVAGTELGSGFAKLGASQTRDGEINILRIGTDLQAVPFWKARFNISGIRYFDDIQHTANYTPEG